MASPIQFFATRGDLLDVLGAIATISPLALTEAGSCDHSGGKTRRLEDVQELGVSDTGNYLTDKTYLVHKPDASIKVREIPQRQGGTRYSLDQRLNRHTVGLAPGGLFGLDVVVMGQLGLGTGDEWSDGLVQEILREMKHRFHRVRAYFVGPEAVAILDRGGRLTANVAASKEFDLVR